MVGSKASVAPSDMRAQILASATRLFATYGFDATAIQAVADDVGIAKQSLLHYFPSKEQLRKSVLEQMLVHWREHLPGLLLLPSAASDRWDMVTNELVSFFTKDPDRARLLLREALDRPAETRGLLAEYVRPFLDAIAAYVRKGQAHGEHFATVDPEAYVLAVIQIVVGGVAVSSAFSGLLPGPTPAKGDARYLRELLRMARTSLFVPAPSHESSIADRGPAPSGVERKRASSAEPASARKPRTRKRVLPMANYFLDNDDLRFYFERGIDWAPILDVTEGGYTSEGGFKSQSEALEFYRQVAEMVGEFAADEIAPHAAQIDREGVEYKDGEAVFPARLEGIFERIRGLELHGMCVPRELGGLNCAMLLYFMNSELLARAEVSVMAHHGFHGGVAMAMLIFSLNEGTSKVDPKTGAILDTRFRSYIEEIMRGEAWGCMDITEPDAGSDMAKLRAIGEQDEDGNWFVTGQKIFITSGHGKYHFVIARTEKAENEDDPFAGLGGLSMFLVQTYEDLPDGTRRRIVSLDRIEEKLGHHGSVTGALSFERAPAHLIGKRGEGFKLMLTLMNNARLGVGFESLGLCEAAYRAAKAYAEERGSMGKKIERHEMIADYLDEMRTDIQAIRALVMHGAVHEELAQKLALRLNTRPPSRDEEKKAIERRVARHKKAARRVTPLLKYFASEKAVEHSRRCVQIHGGNGYTRDYPGEKLLRDAMVMPIYEGTSQIQSLMAMKDTLGAIMKNPQAFVKRIAQASWRQVSARDPLEKRVAKIQSLSLSAQNHLITRTAANKLKTLPEKPVSAWPREVTSNWDPKRDFALAMLHAERLTRLLIDELVCELLFEQAKAHPERRELLERWLDRTEPRARFLHDEITTTGARLLDTLSGSSADKTAAAAE